MTHQNGRYRNELWVVDQDRPVIQPFRLARGLGVAAAFSLAISLAGCAAMKQTVGGWFGAATPTPTPTPQVTPVAAAERRVYYAGVEGLKVYSGSSTSSKVVGKLGLHEKVVRSKLERGFAYVESATTGTKGWVNNAQLIWRLPSVPTTGAPAAEEPEEPVAPEAPPAVEQPEEPVAPEAPAPPPPAATPGGAAPSIFNPY